MKTKKKEDIKDIILSEYKKGNIVVSTFEGLQVMPLDEFVKQPLESILYDLNRDESVILTFIKDPKWVNDFASTKVIRKLAIIAEKKNEIIMAQNELIEIDKKGFEYLQKHYGRLPIPYSKEMEQDIKKGGELRQKIETLKKEI